MAKDFFSSEVCELLARELVTEQAELLKHEVLVKEIKAKLIEGLTLPLRIIMKVYGLASYLGYTQLKSFGHRI